MAWPRIGAQLTGQRADGQRTSPRPMTRASANSTAAAGLEVRARQLAGKQCQRRGRGKHRADGNGQAEQRLGRGARSGRSADEQQLPAAVVLLAAQQTGAGHQPPDRANGGGHDQNAPRGEASDCLRVAWITQNHGERLQRASKLQAVLERRIAGQERLEVPRTKTPKTTPQINRPPQCAGRRRGAQSPGAARAAWRLHVRAARRRPSPHADSGLAAP